MSTAYETGRAFELGVADMARSLGFDVKGQLQLGKRIWGSPRHIDLSLGYSGRPVLGVECKYQASRGSIQENCVATLSDIESWPIPGILVWSGPGYSVHFREWLGRQHTAVHFDNLKVWLERWRVDGEQE